MGKILFITKSSILPKTNGARIYTYGILKYLHEIGHEITLVNFYDIKKCKKNEKKVIMSICDKLIEVKHNRKSYLANLSLSKPMSLFKYHKRNMFEALSELDDVVFDMVVCDHLEMAWYLYQDNVAKSVLIEHNVESNIWNDYSNKLNPLLKPLVLWQYKKIVAYEREALNRFDKVMCISDSDIEELKELNPKADLDLFKPIVDVKRVKSDSQNCELSRKIIFVGSYNWYPNNEAALFLIKELMPVIRKSNLGISLMLIGSKPTQEMFEHARGYKDIFISGMVESIEPYIAEADVFISPIESGSGLNIKLVEALGSGIPIITSEFACRDFDLEQDKDVLVYTSADDLIYKLIKLYDNKDLRTELSNNGYEYYLSLTKQSKDVDEYFGLESDSK